MANLCPAASTFTLEIDGVGLADEVAACPSCQWAQHEFYNDYNITAKAEPQGHALRLAQDSVGGYDTSLLRIGCEGWQEGHVA